MTSLLLMSLLALADSQATFHALFERELGSSAADLHFVADEAVARALAAPTLADAMRAQKEGSLSTLARVPAPGAIAPAIPKLSRGLTLVLVPGVFAEFISNRAFEEVFEKLSAERDAYVKLVGDRKLTVQRLKDWIPGQPPVTRERPFADVMPMGEVRVGDNVVRVILFGTEFGTLESLGDAGARAALFNSRLQEYLDITGPQDLAFVGYSRGTILGLEMLRQAHAANLPWVRDVKALVSLSGVVWGSALADDAVANPASPGNRLLEKLRMLVDSLELVDTARPVREWSEIGRNNARWKTFFREARAGLKEMNKGKPLALGTLVQVDPRSPLVIIARMWVELGLLNPIKWGLNYNQNIERFRFFIRELLAAVTELGTDARVRWWQSATLPTGPTYYALGAAMATPKGPDPEPRLFKNKQAYGNGSYDDVGLLQNRLDYERISGVALNDSQVSVAQAAFLPAVIGAANPANSGLRTSFLGIAGTHHWGLALREVNKMWLGQKNGYPREALLRALAGQIIVDGLAR